MSTTGSAYLIDLSMRLASGLLDMPADERGGHDRALKSFFQPDEGGFAGREGGADIYYTSFALRSLALLEGMDDAPLKLVDGYLQRIDPTKVSLIDGLCWVFSVTSLQMMGQISPWMEAWSADEVDGQRLLAHLESFRRADGGYAKSAEGAASSTYHSFLVVLARELIGQPPPEAERLVDFVKTMQRDDGGFVEIRPMKRGGTNPTAAAIGLLRILDALDDTIRDAVSHFLIQMTGPVGGFRANGRAPACDVLSSFTAMVTLIDLGCESALSVDGHRHFLRNAQFAQGGFTAGSLDRQCDPEYTFYGLGGLALLNLIDNTR